MTKKEKVINVYEAKTNLSHLIDKVEKGEIVIGKYGKPVAKLVPYHTKTGIRQAGAWKSLVRVRSDTLK